MQSTVGWPTFWHGQGYRASKVSLGHSWTHSWHSTSTLPSHASKSSPWRLPAARAGLAGFRAKSHGPPLTPLRCSGCVFVTTTGKWQPVSWDAMLRFSSDLIAMRTDSLVELGHKTQHRWALLLCSQRAQQDKKLRRRCDSQIVQVATTWVHFPGQPACVSTARPGPAEFGPTFCARFQVLLKELKMKAAIPCQLRHGAASRATAVDGYWPKRIPSPFLSRVRPQHRSVLTTCALLYRTPEGSTSVGTVAELTETTLTTQNWNRCKLPLDEHGHSSHQPKIT